MLELRDVRDMEKRSALGENFVEHIKDIHDQVKQALQKSPNRYKERVDRSRREVKFKVGDLVMAYLRKERLPKGQQTKLIMKKIVPLKVLHKYGTNAYELELPPNLGISPIFNVCDLYAYKGQS